MKDTIIVCRCEDITLEELRRYILQEGLKDINSLRRVSRCGMGACQGKTCRPLVLRELATATGQRPEDLPVNAFRPPTKPLALKCLLREGNESQG
ncbi:MAG TPA: (2Fe-2S)-binding protein [Dehalococcoidia bacterium]|nr:(2Fe-2S)-binding protein [Dehalococcoidia bacterium]